MSINDDDYTKSTGNVFADLGIANPQEALAKAELARQISAIVAERGLTQTQAARILGIDQPKVSALMRGRLSGFSIDRLLRLLMALDREIEIRVRLPKGDGHRLRVVQVGSG